MRLSVNGIDFVNRILTDDSIYPFIADDYSPAKEEFTALPFLENESVYVLSPNEYSVFVIHPHNSIMYEIHVNILPEGRGRHAIEATGKAFEYIFTETKCEKLICIIPVICENVYSFALKMGMEPEGILKESFLKNGKLIDQHIMGIGKTFWSKNIST